jgi:hypothetical protein
MPDWEILYEGDKTYTSRDEDGVAAAPTRGVLVILQDDADVGWYLQSGGDYYVWLDLNEAWLSVDIFGLFDYLASPGWKRVLFGRMTTNSEYQEVYHRALATRRDRNSRKSSWRPRERRPDQEE